MVGVVQAHATFRVCATGPLCIIYVCMRPRSRVCTYAPMCACMHGCVCMIRATVLGHCVPYYLLLTTVLGHCVPYYLLLTTVLGLCVLTPRLESAHTHARSTYEGSGNLVHRYRCFEESCACACMYVSMCACACTCVHVHAHVCMYVCGCMYVCVCVCMCVHVCMYGRGLAYWRLEEAFKEGAKGDIHPRGEEQPFEHVHDHDPARKEESATCGVGK